MEHLRYLENAFQDLRYASRALRRSPGFTLVAVLSLGLGIGANTAIFTLIDAVLLKTLPVANPHELVLLTPRGSFSFPYPLYRELRDHNNVLDGLIATSAADVGLTIGSTGYPEQASVELASGNYFTLLGVRPILGRAFTQEDDRVRGGHAVAVLGYSYWTRRFAGDPSVLGKTFRINSTVFTVIGVAPPEFFGVAVGQSPNIWVPLTMQPQVEAAESQLDEVGSYWLNLIGRLKPGVSREQAQASLRLLYAQVREEQYAGTTTKQRPPAVLNVSSASGGLAFLRVQFSRQLWVLMMVVGLVLLIACANVANLLLARAAARRQEIALRIAIGAGRSRLICGLLTESMLLATLGAASGLIFAALGTRALVAIASGGVPLAINTRPDARVLGFTLGLGLLTGLVFGLAPAFRATRMDCAPGLKGGWRAHRAGAPQLTKWLVVVQVALSLVLVIAAGLLLRTLQNLKGVDTGFKQDNVIILIIDTAGAGYLDASHRSSSLTRDLQQRLGSLPGVRSVGLALCGQFTRCFASATFSLVGEEPRPGEERRASFDAVAPGFFQTMGIPLLVGRDFNVRDNTTSTKAVIVNEQMATQYFGNVNPIGQRLVTRLGKPVEAQIVGVVKDAKRDDLKESFQPTFYTPLLQMNAPPRLIALRTAGSPYSLVPRIREELRELDDKIKIRTVSTMEEQINASVVGERTIAMLASLFSSLAVLLASIGLYGVLSYSITRRSKEIGVRMALGASHNSVLRMVLQESLMLVVLGLIGGTCSGLALTGYLRSLLWGITPYDPMTIAGAVALLITVALAAGFLPARRAARLDPLAALRHE